MPTEAGPKPNLFIVGAQKSGTSALTGWLAQHPQVYMSFPKEPGYLAFGKHGYPYKDGSGKDAPASQYVVTDEGAYLNLFANATPRQSIVGEASTWYFALPGMAEKIKAYSSKAKIIVMLRDPVERAYSAWCHAKSDSLEPCESFSAALAQESGRGDVEFLLRYRRMGLYSEALAEYQSAFSPAQLLILFYDDLRVNPPLLWQQVCVFLSINPIPTPAFEHRYNRTGQPRNRLVHRLLRSYRLKRLVRSFLPHRLSISLKQRVDTANLQEFPAIDATSKAELKAYFRSDIEQLSRLTQRDLSAWLN